MLTIRIKTLRMLEEETLFKFNAKLCDIFNQGFAFGEEHSNSKSMCKVPRFHPKRFAIKVTTIEDANDIDTMRINELIGLLQTFMMNLEEPKRKRCLGIAARTDGNT
ncbi:hypothetical protein J1N35_026858 [Gossypium stocksii]|uniref:Gag-pol polyprotein n=1 Tax=Gossypium stocksii TaxID=47602 RepID=A0A9D3V9T7_9ROSI|nr:hypothetical protein J1N35_026858 [Gossypium stocksii]